MHLCAVAAAQVLQGRADGLVRDARPVQADKAAQRAHLLRVAPVGQIQERIGADDVIERGLRVLRREDLQRVDGVDGALAAHLHVAGLRPGKGLDRKARHLQPLRRARAQMRLVRRPSRGKEEHVRKLQRIPGLPGDGDVPQVDGIKAAAHQAHACFAAHLGTLL